MAINAILADKYETAYNYLLYCIKLIKSIKLQRMRVCNMSKLYGMIVYCSYKMGIEYNAHFYLNKMEYVLYHVIHSTDENRFFLWDDDMFFYYFCSGLLEKSDNIEKAQKCFDQAKYHMLRTEGLWFFVYTMFAIEQAELYELQDNPEKAREILEECMEMGFVDENEVFIDSTHVKAHANSHKSHREKIKEEALFYEKTLEKEIQSDRDERRKKRLKKKKKTRKRK